MKPMALKLNTVIAWKSFPLLSAVGLWRVGPTGWASFIYNTYTDVFEVKIFDNAVSVYTSGRAKMEVFENDDVNHRVQSKVDRLF